MESCFHSINIFDGFSICGLQDWVAPVGDLATVRHKSDFNFGVEAGGYLGLDSPTSGSQFQTNWQLICRFNV